MKLRLQCGLTFFGLSALFLIEGAGLFSGCLDVAVSIAIPDDFSSNTVHGIFKAVLFQFAFPYDDDIPALGLQLAPDFLVTLMIASDLCLPKLCIRFWQSKVLAIIMAVPKATVNKNDCPIFWEYYVWSARQPMIIDKISITTLPQRFPHHYFRFSISRPNM